MTVTDRAARRRRERRGAAVLRAVGREPVAEYIAQRLEVGERPVPTASPYLTTDADELDDDEIRGRYDALAVRLRFSDLELHRTLGPDDVIERLVFDVLEQIRCEALVPEELAGVRRNIERAFRAWCSVETLSNSAFGSLLYTVLHVVRSRLVHPIHDEHVEDRIESTRAALAPVIGASLAGLRATTDDQRAYAEHARAIAGVVAELAPADAIGSTEAADSVAATLFVPPEWFEDVVELGAGPAGDAPSPARVDERSLDEVGGYHVYWRDRDRITDAATLYAEDRRRELRRDLDDQIAAQHVSVHTLARRLRHLLAEPATDGWRVGEEEGFLDGHRLTQIVANPANRSVFRQERHRAVAPAVVSFLVDNSGSMKRQRHETVTVLVDTLARALDLAGATSEVLGFTTRSWNGGEPLRRWRRDGESPDPGRLAETEHVVYKDADTSWRRARLSIASMMRTQHFRESVDGEAIVWAYRRLLARPEPRRLLLVVSDGAPMEAATMNANGEAFLEAHLRNVVHRIERERLVEIAAVSVDQPVDVFFGRSLTLDLSGTLTLGDHRVLERLFRPAGWART